MLRMLEREIWIPDVGIVIALIWKALGFYLCFCIGPFGAESTRLSIKNVGCSGT